MAHNHLWQPYHFTMQLLRASSINSFWASADSPEMYRMRGAQKKAAGCLEEAAQNRIIIIIVVVMIAMVVMVVMVVMVIFINLHLHLHQYSSSSSSSSYSTHTHILCVTHMNYIIITMARHRLPEKQPCLEFSSRLGARPPSTLRRPCST